jgi:hypothetical protein
MREYRQDSHTGPLAAWTVLCVLTAVFLFAHANRISDRVLRIEEIAAGAGLLVLGPVILAVYLYRARHVWVGLDRPRGVVVSGRHVIPWESIVRVERRRPRLRKGSGPSEMGKLGDIGPGCLDAPGCFAGGSELGAIALGLMILVAALFVLWLVLMIVVPLLIVPLLEIFAPFGDRIRIIPAQGRPLTLRDLRGADEFMANLPRGVQVVER